MSFSVIIHVKVRQVERSISVWQATPNIWQRRRGGKMRIGVEDFSAILIGFVGSTWRYKHQNTPGGYRNHKYYGTNSSNKGKCMFGTRPPCTMTLLVRCQVMQPVRGTLRMAEWRELRQMPANCMQREWARLSERAVWNTDNQASDLALWLSNNWVHYHIAEISLALHFHTFVQRISSSEDLYWATIKIIR